MMNLSVNIFQFDIRWLNPEANISLIRNHLKALKSELDLLVLPEMYLSGFCMESTLSAIHEKGPEVEELIGICKEFGTSIIGSLAIIEGDKYYNRVLLISEDGIIGRYDKQYLYSPSGESKVFNSKYDTNLIPFKGWKLLPQVCYDLRFPENIRPLPPPDLLIYMANWPAPRIHHWDALLKARAIENLCFTIGCNRLGLDGNGWVYPGHSVIIKPDGITLDQDSTSKSNIFLLSKETLDEYRSKYRFLEDKKIKIDRNRF